MTQQIHRKPKLLVVAGPTAVGKTGTAIQAALEYNGEVISADSIQVYRGMDIGSAKVTEAEAMGVPHHLIDVLDPSEDYNVRLFQEMAGQAASDIISRGRLPILCGGTGFYIQAFLYGIDFKEEEETEELLAYRRELEELAYGESPEEGRRALFALLQETDPRSAEVLHPNNVKRVIRALLFFRQHKMSITDHNLEQSARRLSGAEHSPYNYLYFVLTGDRERLYQRIDRRVDQMMEDGLLEEARRLYQSGIPRDGTAAQGIGYKELFAYFDGETDLDTAVSRIKLASRHFAKRQLTWFRREKNVIWINTDEGKAIDEIREYIQKLWG